MTRKYYPLRYLLDNRIRYLIWYSEDSDGVVTDESGKVLVFSTWARLIKYAAEQGVLLEEESDSTFHNLDIVRNWVKRRVSAKLDCIAFLSAWNLFADISASVGGTFDPDKSQTNAIYHKLFYGNNLPAITPPGTRYVPRWSRGEIRILRHILSAGISLMRGSTKLLLTE